MSLSSRYSPSHAPGTSAVYGLDLAPVLPPGAALVEASLAVYRNTVPPALTTDFTTEAVYVRGRRCDCRLTGGQPATDYRLEFAAQDNLGNVHKRTLLLLCAATS